MSESLRKLAEERADAKIEFYRNFVIYVVVNAFLAVINAIFTPFYWWICFPLFFWGIGIFVKFLKAFVFYNKFDTVSYREQKIEEEMERLRN